MVDLTAAYPGLESRSVYLRSGPHARSVDLLSRGFRTSLGRDLSVSLASPPALPLGQSRTVGLLVRGSRTSWADWSSASPPVSRQDEVFFTLASCMDFMAPCVATVSDMDFTAPCVAFELKIERVDPSGPQLTRVAFPASCGSSFSFSAPGGATSKSSLELKIGPPGPQLIRVDFPISADPSALVFFLFFRRAIRFCACQLGLPFPAPEGALIRFPHRHSGTIHAVQACRSRPPAC